MKISSPEFSEKGPIPSKFTCDGKDINPTLLIDGVPKEAKSLVLFIDDPDAPEELAYQGIFSHWALYNINPNTRKIEENSAPGLQGVNDFGKASYGGPCPPSGVHRYFFTLFALDRMLELPEGTPKREIFQATKGHVIAQAVNMGTYTREKKK